MPSNYALYVRILRLVTDFPEECRRRAIQSRQDPDTYLHDVVRELIATDGGLVWC